MLSQPQADHALILTYHNPDIKNLCDWFVRLLIGKTDDYSWSSSKDAKHRRHCKTSGVFQEIWEGGALPWRLTKAEREELDERMSRVSWPHYIERLYYRGASFWKKPSRMWKSRRKYRLLLYFLPVMLRDKVPRLRKAMLLIVWALRRLEGKCDVNNYYNVCLIIMLSNNCVTQDKFIVKRTPDTGIFCLDPMRFAKRTSTRYMMYSSAVSFF